MLGYKWYGVGVPKGGHMRRDWVETKTPWEPVVGYSRAVKVGPFIAVTGTAALDSNGNMVGVGDPVAQTRQCLVNIEEALQKLGAAFRDVIRTRIYVTDIKQWEAIGRVH